jgi:predicted nucleic acid-binding protein
MIPAVALLDANVLYPAPLRDLLLQLAFTGLYQARWSAEIDDEWKRNLLAARPELAGRIERTHAVMRLAMPDALVTDYAHLIHGLSLPDPDDRHVLAAAITAEADVIVTFNLKDFPAVSLAPHSLVAQHPDAFLQTFIDAMPLRVLAAVRECVARLVQPSISSSDYLKTLDRLGLTQTAAFLDVNRTDWQPLSA